MNAPQKPKRQKVVQTEFEYEPYSASSSDEEPKRKPIATIQVKQQKSKHLESPTGRRERGMGRKAQRHATPIKRKKESSRADKVMSEMAERKGKGTHKPRRTPDYSGTSGEESQSLSSNTERKTESAPVKILESNSSVSEMEQQSTSRRAKASSSWSGRKSKHRKYGKKIEHQRRKKENRESSTSSETDDDSFSPECDTLKNLTEQENKGLIKVFSRFFGKLCYAIKDPNQVAVQLQARRLLSCSVLENLLISPESQQAKAIALVRSLRKIIKSRPDKVFTIIEVCLHNDILKEAGREMWIETGNYMHRLPLYIEHVCIFSYCIFQVKFVLIEQPVSLSLSYLPLWRL